MRRYRVTAVTDAMATVWPDLQEACFAIWNRKFARLRTTAEVLEELVVLWPRYNAAENRPRTRRGNRHPGEPLSE